MKNEETEVSTKTESTKVKLRRVGDYKRTSEQQNYEHPRCNDVSAFMSYFDICADDAPLTNLVSNGIPSGGRRWGRGGVGGGVVIDDIHCWQWS